MNITCHHIESSEDEAAACGSTFWLYASHGWKDVDCPACNERRPTQDALDLPTACPACGTLPEEAEHDPTCPLATANQ